MSFMLGSKALKRLVTEGDGLGFFKAKLSPIIFRGDEESAQFNFVREHFNNFQALPTLPTLLEKFPSLKDVECPEPGKYYVAKLEERFGYDLANKCRTEGHEILKNDPSKVDEFFSLMMKYRVDWIKQKNRQNILDVGKELASMVITAYDETVGGVIVPALFGWPYMDEMGGVLPTEVVSFVGRPATGKTYKMLYVALHNWRQCHENCLFVSMEMSDLAIGQRIAAMYTGTPVGQLKVGAFSTYTFDFFVDKIQGVAQEPAKFYVVDGNLATSVDEIFDLAEVLGCTRVFIDGAYLMPNAKERNIFDRTRANIEHVKSRTRGANLVTFCSWQFNRDAAKKFKDTKKTVKVGVEDIGLSDAIGQISAIVIGVMQDESVETIIKRDLELLKGRDGQNGKFSIHWDFMQMNFRQYGMDEEDKKELEKEELAFI